MMLFTYTTFCRNRQEKISKLIKKTTVKATTGRNSLYHNESMGFYPHLYLL